VTFSVLFLCRANLCRSPSAEVMLARALAEAPVHVEVHSAGMAIEDGQVAPTDFVELALLRGIDLREHRPVSFTPALAMQADLVLPMTRDLLRSMVVDTPALWPRSFTLLEIVRRGVSLEPTVPGDTLASWLGRVHATRDRADLLGNDAVDDIRDPQADSLEGNEVMFGQLELATRRLGRLLSELSG
jgi:protein-tyrosine phosphatase